METKTKQTENRPTLKGREILIALAIKYNGSWDKIYSEIFNNQTDYAELHQYLCNIDTENCLTILDTEYPQALKNIFNPPFVLFIKGDRTLLQNQNSITSVIGTKNPTTSGLEATKTITNKLQDKIICVLASKGTSEAVLDSCFLKKQKAIIVLPSGFDNIYPNGYDTYIAKALELGSCIITEYPNQSCVDKSHFPFSNRIVAGLCHQLVAMEILKNSGSLITINYALTNNREIFVLPVAFDSDFCNNTLIRDGACPICQDEDFTESYR